MNWTPALDETLSTLWGQGLSTVEIGRRMGITKNAVVGRAHRRNLSARPSPIIRGGVPRPVSVRRVAGPTLPPLVSVGAAAPAHPRAKPSTNAYVVRGFASSVGMDNDENIEPINWKALPAIPKAPPPRPVAPRIGRSIACCWPIGEPRTAGFRFCDAEAVGGRPYCRDHCQRAYARAPVAQEAAA